MRAMYNDIMDSEKESKMRKNQRWLIHQLWWPLDMRISMEVDGVMKVDGVMSEIINIEEEEIWLSFAG